VKAAGHSHLIRDMKKRATLALEASFEASWEKNILLTIK
jgi:hypothetical protein